MDIGRTICRGLIMYVAINIFTSCSKPDQVLKIHSGNTTGLDFSNDIQIDKSFSILDYMYFFNGAGVAIGDINNDGLEDVFFAGNQVSSQLYLNQGDLKFKNITDEANVSTNIWCTGVLMEDFNQDGWLDIYVSVSGELTADKRRNLLFVNNGNLTFTERATNYRLDYNDYSTHAATIDYDHDGDLDLYLLNHKNQFNNVNDPVPRKILGESESTDRLLRCVWPDSLSHPIYEDVSMSAGISYEGFGLGVGVSDLNQDGWPDIYVSNDFISNDVMYINQQDGTFRNEIADALRHQSYNGMGNDVADINNDGLADILVADMLPETRKRKSMMANNLTINLQSLADLAGYERQFPRNTLQLNTGQTGKTPKYSEVGQMLGFDATDWSWAPLFVDLDLDGNKDIYFSNGYFRDITDLDFIAYRRKRLLFNSQEKIDSSYLALLSKLPKVSLPNRIFINNSELDFQSLEYDAPNTISTGSAYSDIDNDGDLDLITNNIGSKADVLENSFAAKNNFIRIRLKGSEKNKRGIGSKIKVYHQNHIQSFEYYLSRGYMSTMGEWLVVGIGKEERIDSLVIDWPASDRSNSIYNPALNKDHVLRFSDSERKTNQDRKKDDTDFVTSSSQGLPVHFENKHSDFHHFRLLPWSYSNTGPAFAVADVNNDGLREFYFTGSKGEYGQIAIALEDGYQIQTIPSNQEIEEVQATFFDLEGDGDQDLYVVSGGSENYQKKDLYQDQLFINEGNGKFNNSSSLLPVTESAGSIALAFDFDGDGDIDIYRAGRVDINQYGKAPNSYLLRNEEGKLIDVSDQFGPALPNPAMITDGYVADLNSDGWQDMILAGEWMNITLCYNREGKGFDVDSISGTKGLWRSLADGDFDNDGDLDLIAGNLGLNTGLSTSVDQPLTLTAGFLDANRSYDAIVSEYNVSADGENKAFPIHSRNDLLSQMKSLTNVFPNFISYAQTDLETLKSNFSGLIENEYECTMLASVYIENTGNGKFDIHELPMHFQNSVIQDILVSDFNRDGNLDFLAGGNERGMNILIGDVDASYGVLALGNGDGSFDTSGSNMIGSALEGEVRSLSLIDHDERVDVLVGVNSDSTKLINMNSLKND